MNAASVVAGKTDADRARNDLRRGPDSLREELLARYEAVRGFSAGLCATLEPEDYMIQTMAEASPTKWHLAHTSWFFETFVAKPHLSGYRPLNPQYAFLFNSYYNAAGKMHARPQRGLISRPTVKETYAYRAHVDATLRQFLETADGRKLEFLAPLVTLGLNHEQQHQELMLTDIKHAFWMNPLRPVFRERKARDSGSKSAPFARPLESETRGRMPARCDRPPRDLTGTDSSPRWQSYGEGIHWIGHDGSGFCFDNEQPRHRVFLEAFSLSSRLVTNGEYLAFMEDGGYRRPEFWLSLGWNTVAERGWNAPLYWEQRDGGWWMMTLAGMREVEPGEPVCHVSYFEADAFARWAGARLPAEAEWEAASNETPVSGRFAEAGDFHPAPSTGPAQPGGLDQMFGEVWQWTQSAYSPYPGYRAAAGALGEYNGKFMCNQYVLRGASCATPGTHARRTYRNFFPPDARWQFMGIRLAKDG